MTEREKILWPGIEDWEVYSMVLEGTVLNVAAVVIEFVIEVEYVLVGRWDERAACSCTEDYDKTEQAQEDTVCKCSCSDLGYDKGCVLGVHIGVLDWMTAKVEW